MNEKLFQSSLDLTGKSVETTMETKSWKEFHDGRKAITERNIQLEARTKSKRAAALWASQSRIQVGKLKAWVKLLVIKILPQTSPSLWVSPTIG